MRYSISNAIPHNPKSKKHPYENLVKSGLFGLYPLFFGFLFLCCHSFTPLSIPAPHHTPYTTRAHARRVILGYPPRYSPPLIIFLIWGEYAAVLVELIPLMPLLFVVFLVVAVLAQRL